MLTSSLVMALWLSAPSAWALELCQPLSAQPGQPVMMQVTGAAPGESVVFMRGSGPGTTCPPQLRGACLDMANARFLRSITADASGTATFSAVLPAGLPVGMPFGIQAGLVRAGALMKTAPFFSVTRAAGDPTNDCASGRVCANPDADADLVHDVCDVCPGGDDGVDGDGDGTPDACQSTLVDLVAWWDFNDLEDKSGNGHHAVLQSGVLTLGAIDGALRLDGAADYCTVPASTDFDLTDTLTMAAWVYPESVSSYRTILSRGDARGGRIGDWGLYVTNGELMVDMNYPAGEIQAYSVGAGILADDWYHIAAVIDDTAGYIDFYVDGLFVSRYTGAITLPPSGLGVLLGTDIGQPHDWFGLLDDVRVWGRALDGFEIMELAQR